MINVSVISSSEPSVLSKRATLTPDGLSIKSSAYLIRGQVDIATIGTMGELSQLLDGLGPNQAMAYGTPPAPAPLVKQAILHENPGAVCRSDKYFKWPAGAGVFMVDYDPGKGEATLSPDQLLGQLFTACPELATAPWLWRPSASSFIYGDDGVEYAGLKGQRVYFAIKHAADAQRAGEALFKRLWLRGFGRIEIAQNGALMVKSPIDASVWQPSRLDFAAGAICAPGLSQRPMQSMVNEGTPADTQRALPDLTPQELQQYRTLTEQAKTAKHVEGQGIREAYIATKAQAENKPVDEVRARYDVAEQQQTLCGDFELQTVNGPVTVKQILDAPEQWHGVLCQDPIEPEYRDNAMVGKIYTDKGAPNVDSKAHGGRVFFMGFDVAAMFQSTAAPVQQQTDLLSDIEAHGIDPKHTERLVAAIEGAPLNDMQRRIANAVLQQQLKDAGLLTKAVKDAIEGNQQPAAAPTYQPPQAFAPITMARDITPRRLSMPSPSHGMNAEAMLAEVFANRVANIDGRLRWWTGNHWEPLREDDLNRLLFTALMPDQSKAPVVSGTIKAIQAQAPRKDVRPSDGLVYFNNCVFDPKTGTTAPHHPDNGNLHTLAVDFDPNAHPSEWHTFLGSIFGPCEDGHDRTALLQEIIGFCMVNGNLNIQKAIALDGVTRGGKGVILDLVHDILGNTCAPFTFADLADCKTQSIFVRYGVAVDSDAKAPRRADVQPAIGFLNQVSANERVSIRQLNKQDPWEGRTNCKMLIACNGVPLLSDDSGASTNRFELLRFTVSFEGREDHSLTARLRSEPTGVAMWGLYGLQRLIATGGKFTKPASSIEASEALSEANQPLVDFINEYVTFDPEGRTPCKDVWDLYRVYCSEAHANLMGRSTFYRAMNKTMLGKGVTLSKSMRVANASTITTGWSGITVQPLATAENIVTGAFAK